MNYFNLQDINVYKDFKGQKYDPNSRSSKTFYDTRRKLQYFVSEFVSPFLGVKLREVYSVKPNERSGRGKPMRNKAYVLTGCNLNQSLGDQIFLKFEFGNLLKNPTFNINLDIDFSSPGYKCFRSDRDNIYNRTYREYVVTDRFPSNYSDLLQLIKSDLKELFNELMNYNFQLMNNEVINLLERKNQIILQGPPGTGKTRMAMQLAKALTGINDEADLISSEQVQLVQFHPSYSYEDFVEGLKPHAANNSVVFRTEDGIFKTFCKRALVSTLSNNETTSNENSFDYIFSQYITELRIKPKPTLLSKNNVELIIDSVSDTSITVKYKYSNSEKKAPGTRPFIVSKDKLRIVTEENIDPSNVKNLRKEIKPLVGHIAGPLFAVYTHFYEFMQSLTIDVDDLQTEDYDFQSALDEFKELNAKGEANFDKKYILIIDEMNRANLSTVLGELISLMEDGKRLGAAEELALELPYSKERFGIPKNVYIIGTMNTADRSVSQIDYAIRRRFAFVDVLPQDLAHDGNIQFDSNLFLAVSRLFHDDNGKESAFLSPEFKAKEVQLGHSYFIKKEGGMKMRLEYEIKPILFEYIRDGILKETAHSEIESLTCSE